MNNPVKNILRVNLKGTGKNTSSAKKTLSSKDQLRVAKH